MMECIIHILMPYPLLLRILPLPLSLELELILPRHL
jgi:hypothetical protein